jgi:hypothetical protein
VHLFRVKIRNMVAHLLLSAVRAQCVCSTLLLLLLYYLGTLSVAVVGAHVGRGGVKEQTAHGTAAAPV